MFNITFACLGIGVFAGCFGFCVLNAFILINRFSRDDTKGFVLGSLFEEQMSGMLCSFV
jgi:H+/Cl- antiporter ClcA